MSSPLNDLNDPSLDEIACRLGGVKLSPSAHQREKLLYHCGLAAGRAESRNQLRALSVAAGLLICFSSGLTYSLVRSEPLSSGEAIINERDVAERGPRVRPVQSRSQGRSAPRPEDEPRLTVGTSYQQLLALNRRSHEPAAARSMEPTSNAALTPISGFPFNDRWN